MKRVSIVFAVLSIVSCFAPLSLVFARFESISSANEKMTERGEDASLDLVRHIQYKNEMEDFLWVESRKAGRPDVEERKEEGHRYLPELKAAAKLEADYIVAAQFYDPGHPAHGAINNVYGDPTWIVPRENALAILGLLRAAEITGKDFYKEKARLAADYLVRVQDADGAWFDQYEYTTPVSLSKSPTQTAEVMIALDKLGYKSSRYDAMKRGAQYLMSLQDPANKGGFDDGLISGGKKSDGTFHTWRWTSDNSFAYLALEAAADWARRNKDRVFAKQADRAAARILSGINRVLYVDDPADPDFGVWRRVVDERGVAVDPAYHEWINYAPQMLDLPARGVGKKRVGEWIHKTFQKADGSVVWDDRWFSERKSPGYSFQASLVWLDLGQKEYAKAATDWAKSSGLWNRTADVNGIMGGWVDWTEPGGTAQFWERFIDTSFYAISVFSGGYRFDGPST
jgi:hypothetical protein